MLQVRRPLQAAVNQPKAERSRVSQMARKGLGRYWVYLEVMVVNNDCGVHRLQAMEIQRLLLRLLGSLLLVFSLVRPSAVVPVVPKLSVLDFFAFTGPSGWTHEYARAMFLRLENSQGLQ